jgi:hypothetical protein
MACAVHGGSGPVRTTASRWRTPTACKLFSDFIPQCQRCIRQAGGKAGRHARRSSVLRSAIIGHVTLTASTRGLPTAVMAELQRAERVQ